MNDRKYRVKWRLANGLAAIVILMSVVVPVVQDQLTNRRYRLSQATLDLVGKNNQALANKLKYNAKTETYEFNKEAIKDFNPQDPSSMQVGGADDSTKPLYALDVPTDPKRGVTYHDVNSQLSFKLTPQFDSLPAKTEQGRIVMPVDGAQAVYTLKNNGLKEDIVVTNSKQDTLRFAYKLDLPKSLEARPIDGGGIGIYSGDPTLFTNMSYGSDKDRDLVEKARENAQKTTLVFGIPAPVITTKDGNTHSAFARFELRDNQLTIVAENLTNIKGTFSIDPSVTITSASDFLNGGNNEGNIDFSTSGQISRAGLTGGTLSTWNFTDNSVNRGTTQNGGSGSANGLITARSGPGVVVSNGYMYAVGGGVSGSQTATVEYAAINSNGTVGTWQSTTSLPNSRAGHATAVYSGYIYVSGGMIGGNAWTNDMLFAAICTGSNTTIQFGASTTTTDAGDCNGNANAAGSISSWKTTTAFTTARGNHAMVAANAKLYIIDGCTWSAAGSCNSQNSPPAEIYCGDIRADGEINSWDTNSAACNATGLNGSNGLGATVYNGYIYIAGGCTSYNLFNCVGNTPWVKYAKINTDGSLSSWRSATNLYTGFKTVTQLVAYNGYMYLRGSDLGTYTNDMQYAQINASGDLGTWGNTATLNTNKATDSVVAYNGYLYSVAGCSANASGNCTTPLNGVQYSKITTPGGTSSYGATSTWDSAGRTGNSTVTYGGFIYIIGGTGSNAGGTGQMLNTTRYAAINADGTLGTWSTASATFNNLTSDTGNLCGAPGCAGRVEFAARAYNGYVYMAGGWSNGGPNERTFWSDVQSAVICTSVNTPVAGCSGAGDLRGTSGGATWTNQLADFVTNSTTVYSDGDGRSKLSMEIHNGYMYLVGGRNDNNNTAGSVVARKEIYYAPLVATGGIGTFAATADLPSSIGRGEPKTFVSNNRLYVFGGNSGVSTEWTWSPNDLDDAWFIPIKSDGTLDATVGWKDANSGTNGGSGSSFVTAGTLMDYNVNFSNGYVYVTGGNNGNSGAVNTLTTVYKAQVNTNGSLGTWSAITSLPAGRYDHGTVIANGYLYIIGGCSARATLGGNNCNGTATTSMLNTYLYAQINNGGSDYTQSGSNKGSFTTARSQTAAVAYNGYIYLSGGCTSVTAVTTNGCAASTNDTRFASIASDGSLTWNTLTAGNPTTNRYGHALAVYNGYLYVIGGCSSTGGFCSSFLNDIQYIALSASTGNSVGGWATATNTLGTARYGHSAVVYNGYLYVIGGCSATTSGNCSTFQNTVEYAQISADSSPGTWASTGGSGFSTGRFLHNAVAYGGNLYVLAGCSAMSSGNCTTIKDDVQYASINTSNGTVGSTWNLTTSLSEARYGASVTARNGYLYLIGGCSVNSSGNCSAYQSDIEQTPIYSTGNVGNWSLRYSAYTDPRYLHTSVITNGYLYILGGIKSGPTLLADSQGAGMQLQPRVGHFSKLVDLTAENAKINNILYNGFLSDNVGNISFKVATTATPTFSSSYTAPDIDIACAAGLGNTKVRYVLITVILDDMGGGTGGGTYGETSTANLTDFTVRYNYIRPDPNIRLRLGQTLQQGDLSPLDTCQG
jgi:hypothetical protein